MIKNKKQLEAMNTALSMLEVSLKTLMGAEKPTSPGDIQRRETREDQLFLNILVIKQDIKTYSVTKMLLVILMLSGVDESLVDPVSLVEEIIPMLDIDRIADIPISKWDTQYEDIQNAMQKVLDI